MKTIEIDLEKEQRLDQLLRSIKSQDIKLGKDEFELIIYSYFKINEALYAGFLLLLTGYFFRELGKSDNKKADISIEDKFTKQYFEIYSRNSDVNKLENKIEKEFKIKIEREKRNPLDEAFGLWKNDKMSLEKIREKAWQRTK
jgi:hypothetical protein